MTADRPPEQVIREALHALADERSNRGANFGDVTEAERALAVLLAERDEREPLVSQHLRDRTERAEHARDAAEARAVAAEAERDDWKRQWESAVEDISLVQREAEAELVTLRAALSDLADSVLAYFSDDVERPEPVMYAEVETALAAARAVLAGGQRDGECVCGEINTRHCPVHAGGET